MSTIGGSSLQRIAWPHLFVLILVSVLVQAAPAQDRSAMKMGADSGDDAALVHMWQQERSDPKAWARTILDAQQDLATFGYGTTFTAQLDDQTRKALRSYQERNRLPATGDLDFNTFRHIQDDDIALKREIPLGPPYMFNDSDWNNVFTAEGVWLQQGKEPAETTSWIPSRIECYKSMQSCIVATNTGTLIHVEWMGVESWDQYEIVTQPDDLPCGRERMQISRSEKSVLTTNTAAYKNTDACTKLFGAPDKPMISSLEDVKRIRDVRIRILREASERIKVIPAEAKTRAGLSVDH